MYKKLPSKSKTIKKGKNNFYSDSKIHETYLYVIKWSTKHVWKTMQMHPSPSHNLWSNLSHNFNCEKSYLQSVIIINDQ